MVNLGTHWNTLHHTTTCCNMLQYAATSCNKLQHSATHCSALQCLTSHHLWVGHVVRLAWNGRVGLVCCSVLQYVECTAVCCRMLPRVAACRNVLHCIPPECGGATGRASEINSVVCGVRGGVCVVYVCVVSPPLLSIRQIGDHNAIARDFCFQL